MSQSREPSGEDGRQDLEVGDRVVDRDQPGEQRSPAVVVELPEKTAEEFTIEAVGETVADLNPDHPGDAPVIGVRFERGENLAGPTYHYPGTRLDPIDEEWSPAPPKSDAQRKRERTINQNPEQFDAFVACVKYLGRYPEIAAEWFDDHYNPTIRPGTRGECCHSREDDYRPNTPGAICCWTCNGGGRRPAKYMADDPVPASAPCRARGARDPSETLNDWVGFRVAPAIGIEQDIARAPNPEYDRLHRDAEDLCASSTRRRRTAVLRIAYEATIGGVLDEDYNVARTVAYLRDLGVDTDAVLPGGDPYLTDDGGDQDQDGATGGDQA